MSVYGLMATRLVWLFEDPDSFGYPLGSNMHVITGLVLLLTLPAQPDRDGPIPLTLGEVRRLLAQQITTVRGRITSSATS